jgi:hypothetical protein
MTAVSVSPIFYLHFFFSSRKKRIFYPERGDLKKISKKQPFQLPPAKELRIN